MYRTHSGLRRVAAPFGTCHTLLKNMIRAAFLANDAHDFIGVHRRSSAAHILFLTAENQEHNQPRINSTQTPIN
jgi:hypothetical protein